MALRYKYVDEVVTEYRCEEWVALIPGELYFSTVG